MALKIRRRARLRRKEASEFLRRLADEFGMAVPADEVLLDEAEAGPHRLLLRENEAIGLFLNGDVIPTIRGLLAFPATKRAVTVDMGAVRFSYDGADGRGPGTSSCGPFGSFNASRRSPSERGCAPIPESGRRSPTFRRGSSRS